MLPFPMLPIPMDPRWYEYYWMTERPPRLAHLAAVLRRLRRLLASGARLRSRAEAWGSWQEMLLRPARNPNFARRPR